MANSSSPAGFAEYLYDFNAPQVAQERVFINSSDANLYFRGDLVVRSSAGGNQITVGIGSTSGQLPAGVFMGCKFFSPTAGRTVWSNNYPGSVGTNAANGLTEAYIVSDPDARFVGFSAGTFSSNEIGFNTIIVTSQSSLGNTTTGLSAMIVSTTVTTNASAPWKIVDLLVNKSVATSGVPGTDASAFNRVILAPNAWEHAAGTTGIST